MSNMDMGSMSINENIKLYKCFSDILIFVKTCLHTISLYVSVHGQLSEGSVVKGFIHSVTKFDRLQHFLLVNNLKHYEHIYCNTDPNPNRYRTPVLTLMLGYKSLDN